MTMHELRLAALLQAVNHNSGCGQNAAQVRFDAQIFLEFLCGEHDPKTDQPKAERGDVSFFGARV